MDGLSSNQFKGVRINDNPVTDDLLALNILLYDKDIAYLNIIGEPAGQSVQKYKNIVRLSRFINHICYVSKTSAVFHPLLCSNCDTFFKRTVNLERDITTWIERVKNVSLRNV